MAAILYLLYISCNLYKLYYLRRFNVISKNTKPKSSGTKVPSNQSLLEPCLIDQFLNVPNTEYAMHIKLAPYAITEYLNTQNKSSAISAVLETIIPEVFRILFSPFIYIPPTPRFTSTFTPVVRIAKPLDGMDGT